MHFQVKHYHLSRQGLIRGGGGHKQQIVPKGTKVYCIVYGTLFFWSVYLNEQQALKCADGLEQSIDGRAKRQLTLENMLAWNFRREMPTRVSRPKEVVV